jgi:hypothetical protein
MVIYQNPSIYPSSFEILAICMHICYYIFVNFVEGVLSKQNVEVLHSLGAGLEEGKVYDLFAANYLPVHTVEYSGAVTCAWLSGRHDGKLYAVAFTGEMPEGRSFVISKGVARRTDPR